MFPRLALLPIGLFLIWCFVVSRWYVCHIKQLCGSDDPPIIEEPHTPTPDDRPLVFKWADAKPITRPAFEAFKKSQIDGLGEGQFLEITGCYYKEETAPGEYTNMGLARAALVKAFFIPPLAADQIVTNFKLIEPEPDGMRGDTLFESILFSAKTPNVGPVECIEGSDNSLTVLFPYGRSEREVDIKIEECLKNVIENMKKTSDNAQIIGHTDDAGPDDFNMALGQRRADHIKGILVKNGISANRITTETRGEREPAAGNDTEEGARQNRRAVLTLVKK